MSTKDLQTFKAPLVGTDHARYNAVMSLCKFLRDNHIRDEQDLVSKHGLRILKSNFSSLGSEGMLSHCLKQPFHLDQISTALFVGIALTRSSFIAFVLAEQVGIACLDVHKFEDADVCNDILMFLSPHDLTFGKKLVFFWIVPFLTPLLSLFRILVLSQHLRKALWSYQCSCFAIQRDAIGV
jgi:hypothetical protein